MVDRPVQFDSFLAGFDEDQRVVLSPEDMLHLFRGGTLEQGDIQIIMSDIGWDHVQALVVEASQKVPLLRVVKQV